MEGTISTGVRRYTISKDLAKLVAEQLILEATRSQLIAERYGTKEGLKHAQERMKSWASMLLILSDP